MGCEKRFCNSMSWAWFLASFERDEYEKKIVFEREFLESEPSEDCPYGLDHMISKELDMIVK